MTIVNYKPPKKPFDQPPRDGVMRLWDRCIIIVVPMIIISGFIQPMPMWLDYTIGVALALGENIISKDHDRTSYFFGRPTEQAIALAFLSWLGLVVFKFYAILRYFGGYWDG